MIRRPPRSTQSRSSAASDVYKRQVEDGTVKGGFGSAVAEFMVENHYTPEMVFLGVPDLSLIHISEPTRLLSISYAVFCLKKKTRTKIVYILRTEIIDE